MTSTIHRAANVDITENRHGLTERVLTDITVRNAEEVCAAVVEEWEAHGKPGRLNLDLRGVQQLDSSGVGALMEIRQRLAQANVRLTLCGLHDGPRRLLERTG